MGDSDKASVQTVWSGRMSKRLNETQIPTLWTEKAEKMWEFRVLQQWLWSLLSSELWRLAKDPAAYIITGPDFGGCRIVTLSLEQKQNKSKNKKGESIFRIQSPYLLY